MAEFGYVTVRVSISELKLHRSLAGAGVGRPNRPIKRAWTDRECISPPHFHLVTQPATTNTVPIANHTARFANAPILPSHPPLASFEMACVHSSSPIGVIPDDLVPVILELNEDRWWPCDFQKLALISPAWLGPVRRRLYAFPTVRTYRAVHLLARTLRANPHLLPLLKGIDLRPLGGGATAEDMASLRFLLSLEGLPTVILAGELAIKAERFLYALTMPQAVTKLHIDGNSLAHERGTLSSLRPASLTWDADLAHTFPNLEKLWLANIELDIPHPASPHNIRPTELFLDNVSIIGHLSHLADLSGLRHLSVSCKQACDLDEHLPLVLESCASTLETLRYEVRDVRRDDAVLLDHFPPFPALRDLVVAGVHLGVTALLSIAERCPGLESLAIQGRAVHLTPQEWVTFIRSGAMPRLRELDTPYGTYAPPFKHWSLDQGNEVMIACVARDIRLVCHLVRCR